MTRLRVNGGNGRVSAHSVGGSIFVENAQGRVDARTMQYQVTVDDPKTFTRPFTFTLQQRLMPDTELIEFVCNENNLSVKRLVGN